MEQWNTEFQDRVGFQDFFSGIGKLLRTFSAPGLLTTMQPLKINFLKDHHWIYRRLISEIVSLHLWGSETLKLGNKQADEDRISTVKK